MTNAGYVQAPDTERYTNLARQHNELVAAVWCYILIRTGVRPVPLDRAFEDLQAAYDKAKGRAVATNPTP